MSPFLREISPGLYNRLERAGAITQPLTSDYPMDLPPRRRALPCRPPRVSTPRACASVTPSSVSAAASLPGPRRVEVVFDRHGSKILHLDYARLEIVG